MKPIQPEQFEELVNTQDDLITRVFPEYNRGFLRTLKQALLGNGGFMRCVKHPSYKAKKQPTNDCAVCQTIWNATQNIGKMVESDLVKDKDSESITKRKYEELLKKHKTLQSEVDEAFKLKTEPKPYTIRAEKGSSTESTAVVVASDWHIEEEVKPEAVNGLNKFNLSIMRERVNYFFQNSMKLVKKEQRETGIKHLIFAVLGDFFSNNIHEELMESNQLLPGDAAWEAQNHLIAGIQFYLANFDGDITVICHSGNHGRMTKKTHIATEAGNSLETYMYRNIANFFAGEKRVRFIVAEGYHTYFDIYDLTLRFHHGHSINYGGGVGGITIPVNKAIAQWNKGQHADLDVFGHFHQRFDGGNFIANGSLIGFNAYAVRIKASYEPPTQQFFLINSKFGKTVVAPILLGKV